MSPKEKTILIRVSKEERERLRRNAAKAGMSVSAYIRAVAINSPDSRVVTIDTEPLRRLRAEVHKHGVNLNQLMRFLNTYGLDVFNEKSVAPILEDERDTFLQIRTALQSLSKEARKQHVVIRLESESKIEDEEEPELEGYEVSSPETSSGHRAKHLAE